MKNSSIPSRVWCALGAAAMLAGCGGGDNNDTFAFSTAAPERYLRVDRTAQPGLATALLSRTDGAPVPVDGNGVPVNPGASNKANAFNNQRDALNRGDPTNDARDFAFMLTTGPQVNTLANYHFKLGPQIRSLGLTPCSTEKVAAPTSIADIDISTCVAQVAPVVVPDVMTYNHNTAAGWPNGRGYDDPVIDRLLAAALLKLGAPHGINDLVGVINPTKDETGVASPTAFPFLRAAHPNP